MRRGYAIRLIGAAVAVAVAGCAPSRPATAVAHMPPPRDPDLSPVAERFYEQIVGGHLAIAYGMLSPRFQGNLNRTAFDALYDSLGNAQVDARQSGDRIIVTKLTVPQHAGAPQRVLRERIVFTWDGADWLIDAVDRQ